MDFTKQNAPASAPLQAMSEGEGASMAPPEFSLAEEPMQLTTNPHGNSCDCNDCFQFMKDDTVDTESKIHGDGDDGGGGGTIQRSQNGTEGGESEKSQDSDVITPTYSGKEFVITSTGAKLLDRGKDSDAVATFGAAKKEIAQNYGFTKQSIPTGSVVKLIEETTSHDKGKNTSVAKVEVVSVPDGADATHVGQTYWTTRSNVSAEADENGQHKITAKGSTIRSAGDAVMGFDKIPGGTKVSITDTKGIDEFPEGDRLKNNAARNSFHKNRYMRLYLKASWTGADGTLESGWIKATDVDGGFANEVLGVSEVADSSLESADPNHMTVGTKTAPVVKKGGNTYKEKKVDGNRVLIAQGTYVQIIATSADGKYVKVSSEDKSVQGEWTGKSNLSMSKKKEVGEGDAGITFYEINNDDARVRAETQGWVNTGVNMKLGDLVEIKSTEGDYIEFSKVSSSADRTVAKETQWMEAAYMAPGWSNDLKGANASWGKVVIGGKTVSKYKGQDELVNLGGAGGKMKQVSREAYPNLMKMINAAKSNTTSEGGSNPIGIEINSCFRTFFSQKYFDDNENKAGFNTAATPGWSAHQDSNAFDLNNLKDATVYTWLKKNAWKFDIVQNVKASNERHHWAYVPGKGKEGYYTTWDTPSNKSW